MIDEKTADARQQSETVLVVDDQEDLLYVTAELFRTLGYHALTATNGIEALTILEQGQGIDILFTDVVMPESISGLELARLIRQRYPAVKIILASGYPLPALKDKKMPEFPFLDKPYQLADLTKILRSEKEKQG